MKILPAPHWKATLPFYAVLLFCQSSVVFSQNNNDGVSISPDNTPPHDAAMLDVQSTQKGVLIPRMTETQMLSITPLAGADALQVFVTSPDEKRGLWFYDGSTGVNKWVRYGIDIEKLVPQGVVLPFNLSQCPAGWERFDNADGRFLLGTGTGYAVGTNGGAAKVALQVNELPDHTHTFTGTISGGTTSSETHAHNLYTRGSGTAVGAHRDAEFGKGGDRTPTQPLSGYNTQNASHSHTVSGNVTGTLTNNPALKGEAHENMPPYVVIIYCTRNF